MPTMNIREQEQQGCQQKKGITKKQDIILEKWLNDNKISFEKQKIIAGRTVVDFFIPPNICLYADGDYWHLMPNNKKKDNEINKLLPTLGYVVIRLLGSEIKMGIRPKL